MREPRPFGKHELYHESDLVISRVKGVVTLADVQQLLSCFDEVLARHGHALLLADNAQFTSIDADARRLGARWATGKPVLGMATYNAGLAARTLLTLIMKGINLVSPRPLPFAFVKTESEARAWLAEQRQRHLDRVGRRSGSTTPLKP